MYYVLRITYYVLRIRGPKAIIVHLQHILAHEYYLYEVKNFNTKVAATRIRLRTKITPGPL